MTEMLKSKKFIAAVIGIATVVLTFALGKLGLHVPDEKVTEVLALLAAYIVGQGIADHGKSAALAAPPAAPPAVVNVAMSPAPAKATLSTKKGALVDTLK